MSIHDSGSFEAFLVEDLILTLANLRASLSWLSGTTGGGDGRHRAGWDRFDRQLEMLEARARELMDGVKVRSDAGVVPAVSGAAPVIAAPAPALPKRLAFPEEDEEITNIFLAEPEADAVAATFQSRRRRN